MDIERILKIGNELDEIKERYLYLKDFRQKIRNDEIRFEYETHTHDDAFGCNTCLAGAKWSSWADGKVECDGRVMTMGKLGDHYEEIKSFYISLIDKEIDILEEKSNKILGL